MSLSAHEQQALDAIEDGLAGAAPELVKLLAMFTRLASGEEMPAWERIRPAGRRAAEHVGRTSRGGSRGRLQRLGRQRTFLLLWLAVAISLITVALVVNRSAVRSGCSASWRVVCAGQAFAGGAGLVLRRRDPAGARVVRVALTSKGDRLVTLLTQAHLAELYQLAAVLDELTDGQRPTGR